MPRRPTVQERSQPLPRPQELLEPALVRLCKDPRATAKDVLGAIRSPDVFEALDVRDSRGRTALHWATNGRNVAVVDTLLDLGAHPDLPDHEGKTPLHLVAWFGDLRSQPARLVTQAIWDHMADPHHPDAQGRTPRMVAEKLGNRLLLDCLTTPRDLVARMNVFLTKTRPDQFVELIRRCLALGVDPNGKTPSGCPWLGEAAGRGAAETVALLLAHGASPHNEDAKGMTPLHRGAAYGVVPVIEALLEASPHVHRRDAEGHTPLYLAVKKGETGAVERLLAAGSDPLVASGTSESLLDVAAQQKNDWIYDFDRMVGLLHPALVRGEQDRLRQALNDNVPGASISRPRL